MVKSIRQKESGKKTRIGIAKFELELTPCLEDCFIFDFASFPLEVAQAN